MSWGHLPVQRNSSHNTMMFNNPGVIEVHGILTLCIMGNFAYFFVIC